MNLDSSVTQLVPGGVAEAQRPPVAEAEAVRAELVEARQALGPSQRGRA